MVGYTGSLYKIQKENQRNYTSEESKRCKVKNIIIFSNDSKKPLIGHKRSYNQKRWEERIMLMCFKKECFSITLKSVMYASIYKPTTAFKVRLFIPKDHVICLNVKKWYLGTWSSILTKIGFRIFFYFYWFVVVMLLSLFVIVRLF